MRAARMARIRGKTGICQRVDHYAYCSRLHRLGHRQLRLPIATEFAERGVHFLLLSSQVQLPDEVLVRRALLLTAAYRLHCAHRRLVPFTEEDTLHQAFAQALKEAAKGHSGAVRCLDMVWASDPR